MIENPNPPILLVQFKPFMSSEETIKIALQWLKKFSFTSYAAVPFDYLAEFSKELDKTHDKVTLGVNSLMEVDQEKFTSTVATHLLKERHVEFVLVGTATEYLFTNDSNVFGEKIKRILEAKLTPILSIGESFVEFCDETSKEVLAKQLKLLTSNVDKKHFDRLYIMYNVNWIYDTPWEAKNEYLQRAYQQFKEVAEEIVPGSKLLYSIPRYSEDLETIMDDLSQELQASGYFLGLITQIDIP